VINFGYQITPPYPDFQLFGVVHIEFTLTSDDGSQLFLENQLELDNSGAG